MRLIRGREWKIAAGLTLALAAGAAWLQMAPPDLLRIGSGYAAKMVCSNYFIAGRNPKQVLTSDVQAPGNPLLRFMNVSIDEEGRSIRAALFGSVAENFAFYRSGLGCAVSPDGNLPPLQAALPKTVEIDAGLPWPRGEAIEPDAAVTAVLSDAALTGPGLRAAIVVSGGNIVAERYGPGFSAAMPLLGWSMVKTVNAALIGRLVHDGGLSLDQRRLLPRWQNDPRGEISLADLLAMESGLVFREHYDGAADVTRMLYLEKDMAAYAAGLPLQAQPGTRFSYSSGTSVILSRIWMDRLGGQAALDYPRHALFDPLGMQSAVMEADAAGTFVGSSYIYATARDWARFGKFLAEDGVWNGERLLPEGFVAQMHKPNAGSDGRYSRMQTWLPKPDDGLPADTFLLSGHDGQSLLVIPSRDLVIVRLGLTPRRADFNPVALAKAVIAALD